MKKARSPQKAKAQSAPSLLFTALGLAAIVLFAMFLRYEDFAVWQKHKAAFQYQGEYQMANFDSYYYLQIAKEIQQGDYHRHDKKRRVPDGVARPYVPPLLPALAAGLSSLTGAPLPTVAIFIPVALASLLAVVVYGLCLALQLHRVAALSAALFSILSITYVDRTRIGVFDTDSMNAVFMLLNSYFFLQFGQIDHRRRYLFLGLAVVNTLLYLAWWDTANSVALLSALVPLSVSFLCFYHRLKPWLRYAAVGLMISISLYFIKDEVYGYYQLLFGQADHPFPSNRDIGELDKVSLAGFIDKTLNNTLLFVFTLAGLAYMVWKHRLKVLLLALPMGLALAPFVAGHRFLVFTAPVMALALGHFMQWLLSLRGKINPLVPYALAALVVFIGIMSTYGTITKAFKKASMYHNAVLLDALKRHTPPESNIWTSPDLGYQMMYYLNRNTFVDGGFTDELLYYLYFPLAAPQLSLAANYMQFYSVRGNKGMQTLYTLFGGVEQAFAFLRHVLALSPKQAEQWLVRQQAQNLLPASERLRDMGQWLSFLYPQPNRDVYLFLYYRMTQTATWFKQGNSDLKTGKPQGLPLFLALSGLTEQGDRIKNNQILINTANGVANYMGKQKHAFKYILTYDGVTSDTKTYPNPYAGKKDTRFVFQWDSNVGFGAAMSQEVGNTAFVKLYMQRQPSKYFEPIRLHTPAYQIWKVHGDTYAVSE